MTRVLADSRPFLVSLMALPFMFATAACSTSKCQCNTHEHHRSHHRFVVGADAAKSGLERFKSLAGEWVDEKDDSPTPTVLASYRVVSAGSAVVETLFPGAKHEMVTVYHLDNDALVCTHYCAMGNQPTLECVSIENNVLIFDERSCANVPNKAAPRMGWAKIDLSDPSRVRTDWRTITDGQRGDEPHAFNLKRRK